MSSYTTLLVANYMAILSLIIPELGAICTDDFANFNTKVKTFKYNSKCVVVDMGSWAICISMARGCESIIPLPNVYFYTKTFAILKNPSFRFVCSAAFCFLSRRRGSAIASDQTRCLLMQPSATSTAIYHRCFTFKQHRQVCTSLKYLSLEITSDGKHPGPKPKLTCFSRNTDCGQKKIAIDWLGFTQTNIGLKVLVTVDVRLGEDAHFHVVFVEIFEPFRSISSFVFVFPLRLALSWTLIIVVIQQINKHDQN